MGQEPLPLPLVLDTRVDGSVDFAALSVLPTLRGSSEDNGRRGPHVPVAGSRDWLSSMVEVGRQEVRDADAAGWSGDIYKYMSREGDHSLVAGVM